MKWKKKGLVYSAKGDKDWNQHYAMIPTPILLDQHTIRVFYTSLDKNNNGSISFVDIEKKDPTVIKYEHQTPILTKGLRSFFDESGCCVSSIIKMNNAQWNLYYYGFQRLNSSSDLVFSSMASSENCIDFQKNGNIPILDRIHEEEFLRSAPCVIKHGESYMMWYVSGLRWENHEDGLFKGRYMPRYIIKHAISDNGVNWKSGGRCIDFENEDEFGFGRPWVIFDNGLFKMWYSIRRKSKPYCLGFAESSNGKDWERKDELMNLPKSEEGWDSEMVCYASVIKTDSDFYMFYNGNHNGKTGFGVAQLIEW